MDHRNTIQRTVVLETVKRLKCHATANEIYEAVIRDYPTISRATVYRNLQQLSETGLVCKREMPNGADCYDHICTDHYHVRCVRCGRVFDVDMDYIPDLQKSIKDTHGFEFTGHDIIFKGICPDCGKCGHAR